MIFNEYNGKINRFILITIIEAHDTHHISLTTPASIFG